MDSDDACKFRQCARKQECFAAVHSPCRQMGLVERDRQFSYCKHAYYSSSVLPGKIVPRLPSYRLASNRVTVNWLDDESFAVVGSGEILRRVDSIK